MHVTRAAQDRVAELRLGAGEASDEWGPVSVAPHCLGILVRGYPSSILVGSPTVSPIRIACGIAVRNAWSGIR